jgi:hypothetical protein
MALILINEYQEDNRQAKSYRWANGAGAEVHQYLDDTRISENVFKTAEEADEFARKCLLPAEKKKPAKKDNDEN